MTLNMKEENKNVVSSQTLRNHNMLLRKYMIKKQSLNMLHQKEKGKQSHLLRNHNRRKELVQLTLDNHRTL